MTGVVINQGTQTTVKTRTIGGEEAQGIYLNIGTASDNPFNGTVTEVTTVANLTAGSLRMVAGTVNSGTMNAGTINSGTINAATVNAATVTEGTLTRVTTVANLTAGSVNVVAATVNTGTINAATINTGTINSATVNNGTLTLVTTVSNLTAGSVAVTAGTVVNNGGTVAEVTNGTIRVTAGTVVNNGGTVAEITNGTIRITAGTVTSVTAVAALTSGSVNVIAATVNTGTINAGTVNAATVNAGTVRDDGRNAIQVLTFGTTFGGTGTAAVQYATLVANPGASNYVYVSDLSITNPYGTLECAIGYGTHADGGSVLVKGVYGTQTGIGIEKSFPKAANGVANQPLILYKSGLGTVYANVSYFTSTV